MPWYNPSWNYRQKVTVDSAKVAGASQSGYPVYVDLFDLELGLFSHAKADGGDIRVTESDGTTEIPREIVSFSKVDDNDTKLLLPFNGSDGSTTTTDISKSGHTMTFNGNAQLDTAFKWGGSASLLLDGTGDDVTTPLDSDFHPGSGNFTADFRARPSSIASSYGFFGLFEDANNYFSLYYFNATNQYGIYWREGGSWIMGGTKFSSTASLAVGTWIHLELVRDGNTFELFENGFSVGTITESSSMKNFTGSFSIGEFGGGAEYYAGHIDEFRWVKGVAVHTSDFDPPRKEYKIQYVEGEVHCKPSSVSGSVDTDIYVYYGNAAASDYAIDATYGAENVWDSDYHAVYHWEDDFLDSTANDHDGTNSGCSFTAGRLGNGLDVVPNDYIEHGADSFLAGWTDFSFTIWAKPQADAWMTLGPFQGDGADGDFIISTADSGSNRYVRVIINNTAYNTSDNFWIQDEWHRYTFKREGSNLYALRDGANKETLSTGASGAIADHSNFEMFRYAITTLQQYSGDADETRFSDAGRSDNWLLTSFNNQSEPETFYSVGAEEEPPETTLERTSGVLDRSASGVLLRAFIT